MSTNYSLLFYLKKPKNYAVGAKPIYMRIKGAGSSGIEQPKDEQLPERDCRPVQYHQDADIPHGAAHIRHHGDIGQQRADRNGIKNAGHTNIKTTQHYAKLLDTRIGSDMEKLKEKLGFRT